jgi:hypothetical protein
MMMEAYAPHLKDIARYYTILQEALSSAFLLFYSGILGLFSETLK